MSSVTEQSPHQTNAPHHIQKLPPLEPGDHLDQPTFHARYEVMPEDVKAELIGGVVYMPAASLRRSHGRSHGLFMFWLYTYEERTPGVEVYDNTTTIIAMERTNAPISPDPDKPLTSGCDSTISLIGIVRRKANPSASSAAAASALSAKDRRPAPADLRNCF